MRLPHTASCRLFRRSGSRSHANRGGGSKQVGSGGRGREIRLDACHDSDELEIENQQRIVQIQECFLATLPWLEARTFGFLHMLIDI